MGNKQKFLIALIMLAWPLMWGAGRVDAATYYINSSACSDQYSATTVAQPWCTIQKAASIVNPGDTVILGEGTYFQYTRFDRGGTSTAPITFKAAEGKKAILDGSKVLPNPADPWNGRNGVMSIYANYFIFQHLDVQRGAVQGIVLYGSNNTFNDVSSHDNYLNGLGGHGSNNVFAYCKFYNNKGDSDGNAGATDGFAFSDGSNNKLSYCEAYNNSDDGFDFWISSNNVIEYSSAHDNGWGLNGTHGDGNGFKLGGSVNGTTAGGNNIARFNVAYGNWFNGFDTNNGSNNQIYNNTGYNNYRKGSGGDFRTFNYANTFKNNISFGNKNDLSGPYSASYNSWNLGIPDPKFVSTDYNSGSFLRLSSTSPAIDKGINMGFSYFGSAPDLGAYEFGATTITISPTIKQGDANGDGKVDDLDYLVWAKYYGLTNATGTSQGDFNTDKKVDDLDYVIWGLNYGK